MSGVEQHDRLTGGTFFVLVQEALKSRHSKRDTRSGKSDGLNDPDVFVGLHRIVLPTFADDMKGSTFKQNTSAFRRCETDGSTASYIEFGTEEFAQDCRVLAANNRDLGLRRTSKFINKFLDPARSGDKLVRSLMTLVSRDKSIPDSAIVCYNQHADPMTKVELLASEEVCLEGVLFGLLCYAATETKNVDGIGTFDRWHKPAAPYVKRKFDAVAFAMEFPKASYLRYEGQLISSDHDEIPECDESEGLEAELQCPVEDDTPDAYQDDDVVEAEFVDENEQGEVADEDVQDAQTRPSPTMFFQQNGNNNLQFGSVGTINIGQGF
ncbi:hypothetical protein [Actinomyces vulturis]|uniref:hypothetical protein n=1 Tax=Actinomyces vulturis TaxID=1857645 RepID=UPI0008327E1B|nr:hypothetical protein [Actinomyces vulturis]